MTTQRLTPDIRLQRTLSKREKQIQDLKNSRDYWMKRAITAESEMNKLEVGKTYTRVDGVTFNVLYHSPQDDESLHYNCTDSMWRDENGDAFPGQDDASSIAYRVDWGKS